MDDYEVGYRKPPKASQFKKGQSGNPKGRAKRTPSVAVLLRRELNRRVKITENGIEKESTYREVMARQIATQAAKGDNKKINFVLTLMPEMEALEVPADKAVHPDDQATFENLLKRLRDADGGGSHEPL